MKSLLDKMDVKVDIMYWNHSTHDNSITATVYLYKDDQVLGNRQGYEFVFKYDKRFNSLGFDGHYPKIEKLDFFKMIPEKVVIKYFTDRTKEYLSGYIDRGNIPAFKRIVTEETNTNSTNAQLQKKLIKSLLDSASFEGVCGYNFNIDWDNDRVSGVILKFSSQWYRSDDDKDALNTKLITMQRNKLIVKEMVSKYLNIENLYVGSYLEDCEL